VIPSGGRSAEGTLDLIGQDDGSEGDHGILGLFQEKRDVGDAETDRLRANIDDHSVKDFHVLFGVVVVVHAVPPSPPTPATDLALGQLSAGRRSVVFPVVR
jgi:hypothetical protein